MFPFGRLLLTTRSRAGGFFTQCTSFREIGMTPRKGKRLHTSKRAEAAASFVLQNPKCRRHRVRSRDEADYQK
jgi:hypothetical protein